MKRLSIYFLAIVGAFALASCNTDAEKEFYKPTGGEEFAFSSQIQTQPLSSDDNGVFTVAVNRGSSKGATEVKAKVTFNPAAEDVLEIESTTAHFADGETVAYFKFTYDFEELTAGVDYKITMELDTEDVTISKGRNIINITAFQKLTYVFWGTGSYDSEFFSGSPWDIDFYTVEGLPTMFVIQDLYTEGYDLIYYLEDGEVTIPMQDTGVFQSDEHGNIFFDLAVDGVTYSDGQIICDVEFWLPKSGAWWGAAFREVFTLPN